MPTNHPKAGGRALGIVRRPATIEVEGVATESEGTAGSREPIWLLQEIVDRLLAPMSPIFAATKGDWGPDLGPSSALKSVVLMIFFHLGSTEALARHAAVDGTFRRFLNLNPGQEIDAGELSRALERLLPNRMARQFIRDVVRHSRVVGLPTGGAFRIDSALADAWTSETSPIASIAPAAAI